MMENSYIRSPMNELLEIMEMSRNFKRSSLSN